MPQTAGSVRDGEPIEEPMRPALSSRQSLRPAGLLFAGVAFLALSAIWVVIGLRYPETAWDFPQFYIIAHLPLHSVHDRPVFVQLGERLLGPLGIHYYPPFVRPAVFALIVRPLAWFSYWQAFWIWVSVGFLSYSASILLLRRRFDLPNAVLPVFALYFPSLFGLVTGQDANVLLLVLLVSILLLCDGPGVLGGVLLAVCGYKFNVILFLPLVLLFKSRWRSLAGFVAGASVLAAASAMLAPASNYLALLRTIPAITIGLAPGGLHGVAMRLGGESLYYPAAIAVAAFCVFLIYKLPMLESFCVAIVASLVVAYHAAWYDCAVLVIPIAVAFQHATKTFRTILLLILGLPAVWVLGREYFQVFVEMLLLGYFARDVFIAGRPLPAIATGVSRT